MVAFTITPSRAAARLNSGVRRVYRYQFPETAMKGFHRLAVMGCFAVLATTVNAQSSADQPTTADSTIARYCAAWSTTVSTTAITLLTLLLMQRFVRTPIRISAMLKTLFAGSILFAGTLLFPSTSLFFLFPAALLGIGYLAILFLLHILTREDIAPLLNCLPKKKAD